MKGCIRSGSCSATGGGGAQINYQAPATQAVPPSWQGGSQMVSFAFEAIGSNRACHTTVFLAQCSQSHSPASVGFNVRARRAQPGVRGGGGVGNLPTPHLVVHRNGDCSKQWAKGNTEDFGHFCAWKRNSLPLPNAAWPYRRCLLFAWKPACRAQGRLHQPSLTCLRSVLRKPDFVCFSFFFLLRTASKDSPQGPPTANRQPHDHEADSVPVNGLFCWREV